jgi:two-component system chemotaxis response regulator CheB
VVGIAASAGGLKALMVVLERLPVDFPAAVVVVLHVSPHYPSRIADILRRHTALLVTEAQDGEDLAPGHVYVAAPDHHLLVVAQGRLSLTSSAEVHHLRPSADLLFESIAQHCGSRGLVVVLSGTGSDGAAALDAIKRSGGTVIAQSEGSSEFFGMPGAAIRTGLVDHILPLADIAPKLIAMADGKVGT